MPNEKGGRSRPDLIIPLKALRGMGLDLIPAHRPPLLLGADLGGLDRSFSLSPGMID